MFLENVKHIKKVDGGKVFEKIIKEFQNAGYYINSSDDDTNTVFQLSPHQLGIPQQRERIIFVCIRKDLYNKKPIKLEIPEIPIDFSKIFETNKEKTKKYKITADIKKVLDAWNEMVQEMEVNQKMSPTILCDEFNNTYTEDEFKLLAKWRQDYITKNKPIYNKYKDKWDLWLEKHKDILSKRKIYSKLEWQAGKKKS